MHLYGNVISLLPHVRSSPLTFFLTSSAPLQTLQYQDELYYYIIYSAAVAGEGTLHTYSYVQSHIKDTVENKNLIK